jgi:hypothetical protein
MEFHKDDLQNFEAHGAAPLPVTSDQGYVDNKGARIWYATFGAGTNVIMLHGGLGHSGNWGWTKPLRGSLEAQSAESRLACRLI